MPSFSYKKKRGCDVWGTTTKSEVTEEGLARETKRDSRVASTAAPSAPGQVLHEHSYRWKIHLTCPTSGSQISSHTALSLPLGKKQHTLARTHIPAGSMDVSTPPSERVPSTPKPTTGVKTCSYCAAKGSSKPAHQAYTSGTPNSRNHKGQLETSPALDALGATPRQT